MRNQPGKKNSTTVLKKRNQLLMDYWKAWLKNFIYYFHFCVFNKYYCFFFKKKIEKGTHLKLQFDRFSKLNKFELTTSFMVTSR